MFGETFALNPMFTFFAVQTQLHFLTAANYENNLPPNVGLRPDGELCTYHKWVLKRNFCHVT